MKTLSLLISVAVISSCAVVDPMTTARTFGCPVSLPDEWRETVGSEGVFVLNNYHNEVVMFEKVQLSSKRQVGVDSRCKAPPSRQVFKGGRLVTVTYALHGCFQSNSSGVYTAFYPEHDIGTEMHELCHAYCPKYTEAKGHFGCNHLSI